ncbi:MAG: inositol monophosphatase family protein [Oscillospiraceae bacterium]|nr:inositol monophosphatase family protein [Oscillospiraceae bacterium]
MEEKDTIELINYIVNVGKELVHKSGKIEDIGVKKQYCTEEDIRIERELKQIISNMPGIHQFYSEEENNNFIEADSIWIADPISGTKLFIEGSGNYAIVVSHLTNGAVDFSVVYNPTADKLYIASKGDGISINNNKVERLTSNKKKLIYAPSYAWKDLEKAEALRKKLEQEYELYPSQGSFAYNYCLAAEGLYDGVVSLTKDAFPEFAGCFIANEAGMIATNIDGNKNIASDDRIFVCGNSENYNQLFEITKSVI